MNATTNDNKLTWVYLVAGWVLITIPTLACNPALLNSDTFQYIAVANFYIHAPHWRVQDVYTVGPVIPLLLAISKGIAQTIFGWSRDLDIAVVKSCTLGCYFVTSWAATAFARRRGVSPPATAFAVLLLFFLLPAQQDVVSLNAELICAALFSCFILTASVPLTSRRRITLVSLGALILYTKLQAIILLGLCFYTCIEKSERRRLVIAFLATILGVEIALFYLGGGWTSKVLSLVSYIGAGHTTDTASAANHLSLAGLYLVLAQQAANMWWAITQSLAFFPLTLPLIFAGCAIRPEPGTKMGRTLALWGVATLLTIAIPGRRFEHYAMFWLPLMVFSLGYAVSGLRMRAPQLWFGAAVFVSFALIKFLLVVPNADILTSEPLTLFGPKETISPEVDKAEQEISLRSQDTIFVHGWDYRYYCYFNKYALGPWIIDGAKHPSEYAAEILAENPNYIFDVVNHSGLVRDSRFTLAAHPVWTHALAAHYTKVFDEGGLVVYRRTDAP